MGIQALYLIGLSPSKGATFILYEAQKVNQRLSGETSPGTVRCPVASKSLLRREATSNTQDCPSNLLPIICFPSGDQALASPQSSQTFSGVPPAAGIT